MNGGATAVRSLDEAARGFLGTPFRLHGRDPATGLDCVGLVLASLAACRLPAPPVLHYGLAQAAIDHLLPLARTAGLVSGDPDASGAILLLAPGPARHHLAIRTRGGFVHAHAGLRRVVETPGDPPWPLLAGWHAPTRSQGTD